jgi:putative tryptophan/tyrosine transport system substrate-binding protein
LYRVIQRRKFLAALGGAASWPWAVRAQTLNMPVIGWLSGVSPRASDQFITAFRDGLGEQGYSEGRNLWIYYRWAEGHYDELESLAKDLVQHNVLLIAAAGGVVAARAAKKITNQIPVLFVSGFDPVELGLVDTLNKPGGNATGVSLFTTELTMKRLELLHKVVPSVRSVAFLANPDASTAKIEREEAASASESLGLKGLLLNATNDSEIEEAFSSAIQQQAGAFIISADPFFTSRRDQIVKLAALHSLPGCYPWREYVEVGGLLSYGPDLGWAFRQIGIYAGQILKGAKVAELPVQRPVTFKLAINAKTAKSLGLDLPTALVADEVIE